MKPVLGVDLVRDLETAFDNDACEVGTDCANTAAWWAHNPCGCRMRACTGCREIVLELATLLLLRPDHVIGCGACLTPIPRIAAIVWEPIQ